jgi:hypothetical protein
MLNLHEEIKTTILKHVWKSFFPFKFHSQTRTIKYFFGESHPNVSNYFQELMFQRQLMNYLYLKAKLSIKVGIFEHYFVSVKFIINLGLKTKQVFSPPPLFARLVHYKL